MVESNNIPIHSECMISYPYGVIDSGYSCGWHTGVDFVPHGETENNPLLYPIIENSEVVSINLDPNNALGIYVLLYDGTYYWRYCHLKENTVLVAIGDVLSKNDAIARMGATGNVTGRHLHLECATSAIWNCQTFVNPCDIMNIPNEDDLVLDWNPNPPPPVVIKKHKFNWILFNRKRRFK